MCRLLHMRRIWRFKEFVFVGLQFGLSPKWTFPQWLEKGHGKIWGNSFQTNWRKKSETALSYGIIYMDDHVGWFPSPTYKVPFKVKDGDRVLIELDGPSRKIIFYNMRSKKVAIIKQIPRTHYKFICSVGWKHRQQVEFL